MTARFGLTEATIGKIRGVFANFPQVERAVLYGSRAKGNFKNGSDIDLTLYGGEDLTLKVLYKIMDELDDLLLPYTIDVYIFGLLSDAEVMAHIERVGLPFYARGEAEPVLAG